MTYLFLFSVRINKIPNAGKKLFPSSISRIGSMAHDLENSTEDTCHKKYGNGSTHCPQVP